jgi:hypothetical protein
MGLWLLGKRNQRAAQRRSAYVERVYPGSRLQRRWVRLVCRWSIYEYPGWTRAFATALGLPIPTAKNYLFRSQRNLPLKHAIRLLELSREYESEWRELITDLEAYVAERSIPKRRGNKRVGGKTG